MHQETRRGSVNYAKDKKGALTDYVLRMPSYGWEDANGGLIIPNARQLVNEFFFRLNIFRTRKNWLAFFSWTKTLLLVACLAGFLYYFSLNLLILAFIYGMVIMGTHGTIWYHRYCAHSAFTFSNRFWRFITRNLTIQVIPEEIYVVSHHVHHARSDRPGDPYHAGGGFLYCFLADVNHQSIAENLSREDYGRVVKMMEHTGIRPNTYAGYRKWGSFAQPGRSLASWVLNWSFWAIVFYLAGGPALVFGLFGAAGFWAVGVRTFNYEGHGRGRSRHRDGIDYNRRDLSLNQWWPGYVAGEWHNNHHLFPASARSGFLGYQLDLAWCYIRLLSKIGAVSSYRDAKKDFLLKYRRRERDRG